MSQFYRKITAAIARRLRTRRPAGEHGMVSLEVVAYAVMAVIVAGGLALVITNAVQSHQGTISGTSGGGTTQGH